MPQNHQVRVVKRGQRSRVEVAEVDATEQRAEPSERELRTVMSDWVREHRERTEEYRRTFVGLLRQVGFNPATAAKRPCR